MRKITFINLMTAAAVIFVCLLFNSIALACDSNAISVTAYGANGNDALGDSTAIQAAFDDTSVSKLCFPAGTYIFDAETEIHRDNLTVQGDWEKTILKPGSNNNGTMISIPSTGGNLPASAYADNVVIERMIFEGERHVLFGIWLKQANHITFRDLVFRDFAYEGIAVANGDLNSKNVTIERIQVQRALRNGIHIGACENCSIRNTYIPDAQDPNFAGLIAFAAIDVEQEGYDLEVDGFGHVKDLLIENTLMDKSDIRTACNGINLAPAYGSVFNVVLNHNIGIRSNMALTGNPNSEAANQLYNVAVTDNWIAHYTTNIFSASFTAFSTDNVTYHGNRSTIKGPVWAFNFNRTHNVNSSSSNETLDNVVYRLPGESAYNSVFFAFVDSSGGGSGNENIYFSGTGDTGNAANRFGTQDPNAVPATPSTYPCTNCSFGFVPLTGNIDTFTPPQITQFAVSGQSVAVSAVDPQGMKMRAMLMHDDFPLGMQDLDSSGNTTFTLNKPYTSHSKLELRIYDEAGQRVVGKAANLSVWRPSTGTWYVMGPGNTVQASPGWGTSGDIPVPGDYDGDGKTDLAVFRPSNDTWYILKSSDNTYIIQGFGAYNVSGDQLVPADYDGDRRTDIAVYRPSTYTWYILKSSDSTIDYRYYGATGDIPAPADYDGDGKADAAVLRPSNSTYYVQRTSDSTTQIVQLSTSITSGQTPVPADYDADGKADCAMRSGNDWIIKPSLGGSTQTVTWYSSTDTAVPADYDGDGKADIAVYRPSTGYWYIRQSLYVGQSNELRTEGWGASGDVPVPLIWRR